MTETPDIDTVETADDYTHVRFRDPDRLDEIRTPDWVANAARSVSDGAEVRTGRVEASNDWQVEAVLVEKHVGEDKATEQAREIVETIEP